MQLILLLLLIIDIVAVIFQLELLILKIRKEGFLFSTFIEKNEKI